MVIILYFKQRLFLQRQCRTRWVQIKNKQAKIEREAMATKTAAVTSADDENNELLTPPHTTPSTPAQTISSPSILQGLIRPVNHVTSTTMTMSPTETSAPNSCVTKPDLSPSPKHVKNPNPSYIFTYLP